MGLTALNGQQLRPSCTGHAIGEDHQIARFYLVKPMVTWGSTILTTPTGGNMPKWTHYLNTFVNCCLYIFHCMDLEYLQHGF